MMASAVFVHPRLSRAAIQVSASDYFTIQTRTRADVDISDQITGELTMKKAKWFFNVTQGTLIQVQVLGRFPTLHSAVRELLDRSSR